jgi:hypothetical protein
MAPLDPRYGRLRNTGKAGDILLSQAKVNPDRPEQHPKLGIVHGDDRRVQRLPAPYLPCRGTTGNKLRRPGVILRSLSSIDPMVGCSR